MKTSGISKDGGATSGNPRARIGRKQLSCESPAFPNGNLRAINRSPGRIAGRPGAIYERNGFPFEGDRARFKNCPTKFKTDRASPRDRAAPPGSSRFPSTDPRASPDRHRFPPERIHVPPIGNATTPEPNRRIFDVGRADSGPEHATEESNAVSDPPFLALKARLRFGHGRELLATDSPS
jgi:hypothetical protein